VRRAALLVALVVCAGCGGSKASAPSFRGTELTPPPTAPGFTLTDQQGRPVSLADARGRYQVVTFIYTRCPDVCPVIAGNLNRVLKTAVARRVGLRVLAVSVDPKHDTAAAVRRYVRAHRLVPQFRYLIGDDARLARVWRDYHVAATPGPNGTVSHSTFEILVDPKGKERFIYDASAPAADFVHDLALLEDEG
jgi:protein SCO1